MQKPLPSYKQGLADAYEAVNALGAPDSACTSAAELNYCRAIGDVLAAIEALQVEQGKDELMLKLETLLKDLRKPYNGFVSPAEASRR
jgi:hypothetical protein